MADPGITFVSPEGFTHAGRFICQAEVAGEVHGTARGTDRLSLPAGLNHEEPQAVLQGATLDVQIETAMKPPRKRWLRLVQIDLLLREEEIIANERHSQKSVDKEAD